MMQRMAGNLPLDAGVPVTPFSPPRGNFAMASVQLEVDLLKKTQEATLDAQEVAAFLHKTFHNHVFKVGQTFAGGFQDGAVGLKLTVRGFEYIDLGGGGKKGERARESGSGGGEGDWACWLAWLAGVGATREAHPVRAPCPTHPPPHLSPACLLPLQRRRRWRPSLACSRGRRRCSCARRPRAARPGSS
jgi:hypothetical protein